MGNVTPAPTPANVSLAPNATGVTEQVRTNTWALLAIVVLGLALIGVAAWDLWQARKKK
jgi:hypothetical protein